MEANCGKLRLVGIFPDAPVTPDRVRVSPGHLLIVEDIVVLDEFVVLLNISLRADTGCHPEVPESLGVVQSRVHTADGEGCVVLDHRCAGQSEHSWGHGNRVGEDSVDLAVEEVGVEGEHLQEIEVKSRVHLIDLGPAEILVRNPADGRLLGDPLGGASEPAVLLIVRTVVHRVRERIDSSVEIRLVKQ